MILCRISPWIDVELVPISYYPMCFQESILFCFIILINTIICIIIKQYIQANNIFFNYPYIFFLDIILLILVTPIFFIHKLVIYYYQTRTRNNFSLKKGVESCPKYFKLNCLRDIQAMRGIYITKLIWQERNIIHGFKEHYSKLYFLI